jgi:hypothetical protein
MGILGKASDKPQFELTPVGEYVFTLWDITLETGQWGDQIKWVWLISPTSDPESYVTRGDGAFEKERELWQFTKIGLPKGSRAREWAEALMGRELKLGEEPDDTDLVRRRMIAYLVHKPKKSDPTIKQESISEGSARPFRAAQPAAKAGPVGLSSDPSMADIDAALAASDQLRKRVKKLIRNADLDDITEIPKYGALDDIAVGNLADGDLLEIEQLLTKAMQAAA